MLNIATILETQAISCPGAADGELSVSATGGTGTKTFAWSNGQNGNTATGLSEGTYVVTATDGNGCTAVDSLMISDPPDLVTNMFVASIIYVMEMQMAQST